MSMLTDLLARWSPAAVAERMRERRTRKMLSVEMSTPDTIFACRTESGHYRFHSGAILKLCPKCWYKFKSATDSLPQDASEPRRIVCPGCLGDVFLAADPGNPAIVRYRYKAAPFQGGPVGSVGPETAVDYSTTYMINRIGLVERDLGASGLPALFEAAPDGVLELGAVFDFFHGILRQVGTQVVIEGHEFKGVPLPGEACAWISLVKTVEARHQG